MKEHPILFSGPMVRAILDDKKTQTRRVMKPQPAYVWGWGVTRSDPEHFSAHVRYPGGHQPDPWVRCPYGKAGDRLWVRETWMCDEYGRRHQSQGMVRYRADAESMGAWRPSIHMPRWASRLALENKGVRVERLQDISEVDAYAEGIPEWNSPEQTFNPVVRFHELWDEINPKYSWESNPWVWVIEFKRVKP